MSNSAVLITLGTLQGKVLTVWPHFVTEAHWRGKTCWHKQGTSIWKTQWDAGSKKAARSIGSIGLNITSLLTGKALYKVDWAHVLHVTTPQSQASWRYKWTAALMGQLSELNQSTRDWYHIKSRQSQSLPSVLIEHSGSCCSILSDIVIGRVETHPVSHLKRVLCPTTDAP